MAYHQITNAFQQFQTVLQYQPGDFEAHAALVAAFLATGKSADAIAEYTRSLTLQQNQPETLNDLAWILATDSDAKLRNGTVAVKLAERACVLTGGGQPMMIGTLAAASGGNRALGGCRGHGAKGPLELYAVKVGLRSLAERNASGFWQLAARPSALPPNGGSLIVIAQHRKVKAVGRRLGRGIGFRSGGGDFLLVLFLHHQIRAMADERIDQPGVDQVGPLGQSRFAP